MERRPQRAFSTFRVEGGVWGRNRAATAATKERRRCLIANNGGVVRGLEWELERKWGGNNGDKVKTKKEGENYRDRHAVLYLGFTLTVLDNSGRSK